MTPAIGASTIGNSVLKRSMIRRSGHMVACSLGSGLKMVARQAADRELRRPFNICSASVTIRQRSPAAGGISWISPTASPAMTAAMSKLPAALRRGIFGGDRLDILHAVRFLAPDPAARMIVDQAAAGERRRPDIVAREIEDDAADAVAARRRRCAVSLPLARRIPGWHRSACRAARRTRPASSSPPARGHRRCRRRLRPAPGRLRGRRSPARYRSWCATRRGRRPPFPARSECRRRHRAPAAPSPRPAPGRSAARPTT